MDPIWKQLKNFKDLQDAMVSYLEGKHKRNPWCCSTIDTETIPMLISLVKINSLGFVTIVSQPGVNTIYPDGYSEYQRGFITGFILKEKADIFIESLLKIGRIVICKAVLGSGEPPKLYGNYKDIIMERPIKKNNDGSITRGTGRFINVTKELIPEGDTFLKDLDEYEKNRLVKHGNKLIRYYTNKWLDYETDETDVLLHVNEHLLHYLHQNTYQLTVIRSEYGDADLDSIILETLSKL